MYNRDYLASHSDGRYCTTCDFEPIANDGECLRGYDSKLECISQRYSNAGSSVAGKHGSRKFLDGHSWGQLDDLFLHSGCEYEWI